MCGTYVGGEACAVCPRGNPMRFGSNDYLKVWFPD
jgi:hypothetical protein